MSLVARGGCTLWRGPCIEHERIGGDGRGSAYAGHLRPGVWVVAPDRKDTWWVRLWVAVTGNLAFKLIALIAALVLYALVHAPNRTPPEAPAAAPRCEPAPR